MAVEDPSGVRARGAERHEGGGQARVEDPGPGEQPGGGVDGVREEGGEQQGAARAEQGQQPAEERGEVADVRRHFAEP